MPFSYFHNLRAARRYLPKIYVDILAVDRLLKPSYLWDVFDAQPGEIQKYLEHLFSSGKINQRLKAISIGDNIFIANPDSLQQHMSDVLVAENINVVDVSKQHSLPSYVPHIKRDSILRSVVDGFHNFLSSDHSRFNSTQSSESCNMTTLFGAMLGYPILYWYDICSTGDQTCLPMLPLKVLKVLSNVDLSKLDLHPTKLKTPHELYSFSIPDMLSNDAVGVVCSWITKIKKIQEGNQIFNDLKLVCSIVTLPAVVL